MWRRGKIKPLETEVHQLNTPNKHTQHKQSSYVMSAAIIKMINRYEMRTATDAT